MLIRRSYLWPWLRRDAAELAAYARRHRLHHVDDDSNTDPRFAAGMANAFVQAYLDTTVDLKVDPARQYSGFFGERAKAARERLEELQTKYSEFQKANGIIASDERLDVESSRLSELSSQLVMMQALAAESASRQTQAAGE